MGEEFARSRRYGHALSLIVFEIVAFNEINRQQRDDILTVLSLIFQNKLRRVDLVFHDREDWRDILVLPGTPLKGAQVVNTKIAQEIMAFKFRPYSDPDRELAIQSGVVTLDSDMANASEFIEQAKAQMALDQPTGQAREMAHEGA